MGVYSIKDLERISGVKAHTIRIWERRYNIVEPARTKTNIRKYSDRDLKRLLNVSILNNNGYKISHIAYLSDEDLGKRLAYLCLDTKKVDIQVESLMVAMLELDEVKFNSVLNQSIIKRGFEKTVEEVLFPFLDRVGILWQAGSVNPAQEHFMSNLIRQKLIVAIDNQMENQKVDKRITFFLDEGELHEIGLLFYSFLARKEGYKVIYLGSNVPFEDIKGIDQVRKADAFFTCFVSPPENSLDKILKAYSEEFPNTPIFINGMQVKEYEGDLPDNVMHISSAEVFVEVLRKM
ncbi:MerR family transcriptional regulator [Plebeiibacterium marinum]|uniref:MerR family transcriptional regulator n=1 Tax=Plebeiibacterium marinum TaxID=2992111 RepID=A0AAE3SIQ2_9BACT|nr:MerR family transcriptional regulator [Plebeiobacterium marinum]MCW3804683.1 MerR family transcriptional regulator [Plebeiobacterium marinum]